MTVKKKITISKLDAARRQLQIAIKLWFAEDDPVSVHTLAYAAYEIIHRVSKERNPSRAELMFDAPVKKERRVEFVKALKEDASFFKHAETDVNGVIEFIPELSFWFLFFSAIGVQACGEQLSYLESAILTWTTLHHPDILSEEGRALTAQRTNAEQLQRIRAVPRNQFLQKVQITR
jgi:hypothetical protein